jgi:formylmethanofuran dehydrogenase subunit E-like metal-binding protein
VPNWCKDDAFLLLMNLTPGKSGFAITYLNNDDKASLIDECKNDLGNSILAGIMCVQKNGAWTAHVMGFDFDAVRAAIPDLAKYPNMSKFMMNIAMLDMAPEDYVTVIKTIDLPAGAAPLGFGLPGLRPPARHPAEPP